MDRAMSVSLPASSSVVQRPAPGINNFQLNNTIIINERKTMAIHLEANYSKKLGLPGYSSHQYSVTIKTEVSDLSQAQAESSRLYDLLQSCVDKDIQRTGYLPQGGGNGNGAAGNSAA